MISKILALLMFIIVCYCVPAALYAKERLPDTKKTAIAILDIEARNVPAYFASSIRSILEYHLTKSERFSILERQNINRIINENRISRSRVKKIATLLPADYLVSGSIEKIGNYQVLMRVISRTDGKILFAYAEQFREKKDYNTVINILSRRITDDIIKHSQKQVVKMYDDLNIYMGIHAGYLVPFFTFKDIATRGTGVTMYADIEDIPLIYSLQVSYFNYSMISDELPELSSVPVLLGIGYRYNFLHTFYLAPRLYGGINYTFGERADSDKRERYTGVETAIRGEVVFGIELASKTNLEFGAGYLHVFDRGNTIGGVVISFGFKVLLYGR